MTQEAGKSKEQEAAWQEHIRKMHPSWHKDVYKDFFIAGIEYAHQREQPWVRVEPGEKIPNGDWLVYLEKELNGRFVHSAKIMDTLSIIATVFSFDAPKITHYRPLPAPPKQ